MTTTLPHSGLMSALLLAALLATGITSPLLGQTSPDAQPVRVLVVATYHFANPGLDMVQVEVPDILGPNQQEQVARIVDGLAAFRPTKVAVEQLPETASRLDSVYSAYLEGRHPLGRNEVQQLGFRLAERMGLPRVNPVDHAGEFPMGPVMQYASEHDPAMAAHIMSTIAQITEESNRQHREWTVGQILWHMNQPEELAWGHGVYLSMNGVGAGDTQVGADLLARWYERNIRMFAHLQAVAEPGDRIILIVGQSHAPILRELVEGHPNFELVDPLLYLPER